MGVTELLFPRVVVVVVWLLFSVFGCGARCLALPGRLPKGAENYFNECRYGPGGPAGCRESSWLGKILLCTDCVLCTVLLSGWTRPATGKCFGSRGLLSRRWRMEVWEGGKIGKVGCCFWKGLSARDGGGGLRGGWFGPGCGGWNLEGRFGFGMFFLCFLVACAVNE